VRLVVGNPRKSVVQPIAALPTGHRGFTRPWFTPLLPSLLVDPPQDAKVSTLEVFGPTTCVYPFTRVDDAIAKANALPFAFQSSVFTEDLRTAFDAAERLAAAAVMVNDHTAFRTDWMPFAGHRRSGYGIGGIPWTMDEMSQEKMIVFRM
jgi:acyl-CoA reductase-like NAD-dependent aldehyde dehydrogenase